MDLSNISILNLMPPNLAKDHGIRMLAMAFDEVLREIISKIPDVAIIPNLVQKKIVDETLIDLLAWQFHVDFYEPDLPIEVKRDLVLKSLDWHFSKGTPSVVEEIVSTVFSKAKIEEWFEYGGLPYRFRVSTEDEILDTKTIKKLIRAINSVKNTRSFLDTLNQVINYDVDVYFATGAEFITKQYIIADDVNFEDVTDYGAVAPMMLTKKYIIVDEAPMPNVVTDSGATATHQIIKEVH
jgi:phage tail P2-like protein